MGRKVSQNNGGNYQQKGKLKRFLDLFFPVPQLFEATDGELEQSNRRWKRRWGIISLILLGIGVIFVGIGGWLSLYFYKNQSPIIVTFGFLLSIFGVYLSAGGVYLSFGSLLHAQSADIKAIRIIELLMRRIGDFDRLAAEINRLIGLQETGETTLKLMLLSPAFGLTVQEKRDKVWKKFSRELNEWLIGNKGDIHLLYGSNDALKDWYLAAFNMLETKSEEAAKIIEELNDFMKTISREKELHSQHLAGKIRQIPQVPLQLIIYKRDAEKIERKCIVGLMGSSIFTFLGQTFRAKKTALELFTKGFYTEDVELVNDLEAIYDELFNKVATEATFDEITVSIEELQQGGTEPEEESVRRGDQ